MRKTETYVESTLGTAHVWGLDVEVASEFPLFLGLLGLTSAGDIDLPAIVIDELALALKGHLVVGEGHLGRAVAVVVLKSAHSLLDLLACGGGAILATIDSHLDLLLQSQILHRTKIRVLVKGMSCRDKNFFVTKADMATYNVFLGLGGEAELPVNLIVLTVGVVRDVSEAV